MRIAKKANIVWHASQERELKVIRQGLTSELKTGCELGQLLVILLIILYMNCSSRFIDILWSLSKHVHGPLEEVDSSM